MDELLYSPDESPTATPPLSPVRDSFSDICANIAMRSAPCPSTIDPKRLFRFGRLRPEERIVKIKKRESEETEYWGVYIGDKCSRAGWKLSQSKWANPFATTSRSNQMLSVYKCYVMSSPLLMVALPELAGKTLGCWCNSPCHGEVLIELLHEYHDIIYTADILT